MKDTNMYDARLVVDDMPGQPRETIVRIRLPYYKGDPVPAVELPVLYDEPYAMWGGLPAVVDAADLDIRRAVFVYRGDWYVLDPADPTVCVYEYDPDRSTAPCPPPQK